MPTPSCGFKPCAKLFCVDYPEAVCKPNFCGGCNAEFYYKGERVECSKYLRNGYFLVIFFSR